MPRKAVSSALGPAGPSFDLYLEVHSDHSVLIRDDGTESVYEEGPPTPEARARQLAIRQALDGGYLQGVIDQLRSGRTVADLPLDKKALFDGLVGGVTGQVGRALVGLTVLMACVKAICPQQSIRLHKAGRRGENFAWTEGISMRSLDHDFITPVLRRNELLSLNQYGFMMTRTLAENYPYSPVYKAALRGPKQHWVAIVEALETQEVDAAEALKYLLSRLLDRSTAFRSLVVRCEAAVTAFLAASHSLESVRGLIQNHIATAPHSARLLEVAVHSLMQCIEDHDGLPGILRPLGQMRSANKKAGNIGDIEVVEPGLSDTIIEAWDAKYRQAYLRDSIDELADKLPAHPETRVAGFILEDSAPADEDATTRLHELQDSVTTEIMIVSFEEWTQQQTARAGIDEPSLAKEWLKAYSDVICLQRRDRAPLDEPTQAWIARLIDLVGNGATEGR